MITEAGANLLSKGMDPTLSMALARLLEANVDNDNLSDADFRLFVRNSVRVLQSSKRQVQVEAATQPA